VNFYIYIFLQYSRLLWQSSQYLKLNISRDFIKISSRALSLFSSRKHSSLLRFRNRVENSIDFLVNFDAWML